MGYEPARPRYVLPFAGEEYDVTGTLEVVEAVELAFKESILHVVARAMDMGVTDTARLLEAVLKVNGQKVTSRGIARVLVEEYGAASDRFDALRIHLYAFLRIMLEPPEAREQMATKMGEITGKLAATTASPGGSTRSSV